MRIHVFIICGFFGLAIPPRGLRANEPVLTDLAVLFEVFELSPEFSRSLDPGKLADPQLRKKVDEWIVAKDASLVDCSYLRLEPSTSASLASRLEVMYGTEGDPPEVPNEITLDETKGERMRPTDSTFTAFESDFEGFWSDVEAHLVDQSEDGVVAGIDPFATGEARLSEQFVALSGSLLTWKVLKEKISLASDPEDPLQAPLADKWQPTFASVSITESSTLPVGQSRLIQMVESPRAPGRRVLIFVTGWILRDSQ